MTTVMSFNEFQRKLAQSSLDERQKYFLTMQQEQIISLDKSITEAGKAIIAIAEQMEQLVELHGRTQEGLQLVRREVRGIDEPFQSVLNDPEESKKN